MRLSALRMGSREHELAATIGLLRIHSTGWSGLAALIEDYGSAVAALQTGIRARGVGGAGTRGSGGGPSSQQVDLELDRALREASAWSRDSSFDVCTVLDADYPAHLREVPDRPALIFGMGAWRSDTGRRPVAVIGAPIPSDHAVRAARAHVRWLVEHGYTPVSGLHVGIETVVHQTARRTRTATLAVAACGFDRMRQLRSAACNADHIIRNGGGILTPFFPYQNRADWTLACACPVITGLAGAVLVMDAGEMGNTEELVHGALLQGRAVLVHAAIVRRNDRARRLIDRGINGQFAISVNSPDELERHLDAPVPAGTRAGRAAGRYVRTEREMATLRAS